jgi:hypothetical protein
MIAFEAVGLADTISILVVDDVSGIDPNVVDNRLYTANDPTCAALRRAFQLI